MDNVSKVGIWPTTIVVPADIHKALIRNKLRLSDYVKFDKVKSALSSTDIKHWYSVIDLVKIGGKKLGYPLMCQSGMDTGFPVPGFDQTHFDPYYSPSQEDLTESNNYLYQSNAMTENYYSLYRDANNVFVVVEPGFSLMIEENTNKLEFLKSYYRMLSAILPIHELAKDKYHLEYVSLITT